MTKGIFYENSQGTQIRFDGANIRVKESDLRDFTWSYSLSHKPNGYGSRLNRFSRPAIEKSIGLSIRGRSREECIEALNALHAATEADITRGKPGRLYLDGQYLICYLGISSKIEAWRGGFHFLEKTLTILVLAPFWYTEVTQAFRAGEVDSSQYGKRYNGRYPYQYGTGYANKILYNDHHSEAPAIITIYGPCEDPQIYIAGNLYGISGAGAGDGERIVLDQLERTIYRVSVKGETTNLFDYRIKTSDQFIPIPSGDVAVQFSGEFGFDVKLMQQRSEPKWI
ncbi:MAG: hypothetical protein IJB49_05300 [Clostridia bacterium]|nr:hypothetical protein [Clostridia bacterium]